MSLDLLRFYLLAGLLTHKAVWEVMKRKSPAPPPPAREGLARRLVKLVKVGILLGIVAQTLLPDILPLASDPGFSRVLGAVVFTAGLAIALLGRIQLGNNWSDIESAVVRRKHQVVSRGIYRYVRHPIYSGDLLLLLGFEIAVNSWLVIGAILLVPVVFRQAVKEEQALSHTLPGYRQYCERTRRFIPFLA